MNESTAGEQSVQPALNRAFSFSRFSSLCCPRRESTEPSRGEVCDQENAEGGSIYYDALRSQTLNESDLASLRDFENAFHRSSSLAKSLYFDAAEDESSPLYPYAPAACPNRRPRSSISMEDPETLLGTCEVDESGSYGGERRWQSAQLQDTVLVTQELDAPTLNFQLQGYPGELTKEELSSCLRFRSELNRRKKDGESRYREMIDAFHGIEGEPYALCRFLRARKFDVDAVFDMITESLDVWSDASRHNFYPDPDDAIGAPFSVLLTQYPFLYSGIAKNGCAVSYFKAGIVSVEGIDCVTDFENLSKMVWHNAMHSFPKEIKKAQAIDPDAVRCESVAVIDIHGLAPSNFNARTLEVLKAAVKVNVCFPEILNSMVVLNAPSYFSFTWRIIKGLLDPRTASKIEIFADKKKGRKWLLDRIEEKELLSDYGGSGLSFDEVMQMQGKGGTARRKLVELMTITNRSQREVKFTLTKDETISLEVYTRSKVGAKASLFRAGTMVKEAGVKNSFKQGNALTGPYCVVIASGVSGPGEFSVVVKSKGKESNDPDHFLVIGLIN